LIHETFHLSGGESTVRRSGRLPLYLGIDLWKYQSEPCCSGQAWPEQQPSASSSSPRAFEPVKSTNRLGVGLSPNSRQSRPTGRARIRKEGTWPMSDQQRTLGIDVSKQHLDVHLQPDGAAWRVANNDEGVRQLTEQIVELKPVRVVVESTGGYERPVLYRMLGARLPVAMVNPRPVRDFAKAMGLLAKTDRIDAKALALFARHVPTRLTVAPSKHQQALRQLVIRRQQLVEQCVTQRGQLEHVDLPIVSESIQRTITHLQTEIAAIESMIQQLIDQDDQLRDRDATLRSVKGVGPATARVLVTELPELGCIGRRQVAALVGVAPYNHDSGTHRGQRHTRGGRATVRRALYMATLVATRHNPVIRDYYQHLQEQGKPKKVALVACMRKLLIRLNALIAEQNHA
jgi:transposase